MQVADENGLEFLDLKLKIIEGKINIDVCPKPTDSFTYVHHQLATHIKAYKTLQKVWL